MCYHGSVSLWWWGSCVLDYLKWCISWTEWRRALLTVAGWRRGANSAMKKLLRLKRYVSSSNTFESVGLRDIAKDKNKSTGINTAPARVHRTWTTCSACSCDSFTPQCRFVLYDLIIVRTAWSQRPLCWPCACIHLLPTVIWAPQWDTVGWDGKVSMRLPWRVSRH